VLPCRSVGKGAPGRRVARNEPTSGLRATMSRTRERSIPTHTARSAEAGTASRGNSEIIDLWFALARFEWSCLVIVPAGSGSSAEKIARSLAEAGQHLSDLAISAVSVRVVGPASVRALLGLVSRVREGQSDAVWPPRIPNDVERLLAAYVDGEDPSPAKEGRRGGQESRRRNGRHAEDFDHGGERRSAAGAPRRLIIAIPSVLTDPLGIAVARAADGVLLTIEMNRTRLADAARSAEAIGRERLVGACLVSTA
jgi:hypothetical protein